MTGRKESKIRCLAGMVLIRSLAGMTMLTGLTGMETELVSAAEEIADEDAMDTETAGPAAEDSAWELTASILAVTYDNMDVRNGNYYQAARTATITIAERNLDAGGILLIEGVDGSIRMIRPSWSLEEGVYTTNFTFDREGHYTFDIAYMDMAGNYSIDYEQDTFCIDWTKPQIVISGVEDGSANTGTAAPVITITDSNYDAKGTEITLVGLRYGGEYSCSAAAVADGQSFTFANIEMDDIYVLTVDAVDLAGNRSTQSIRFSVNRSGSTYDISALWDMNQSYLTTESMTDLLIREINPNRLKSQEVTLYKNGRAILLAEGTDYSCRAEHSEDGWYDYTYRIFREQFAEDGTYSIRISSVDEAENPSENMLDTSSEINFIVDNTKPTIILTNLENEQRYEAKSYEVVMVIHDNMALSRIEVTLDGEAGYRVWEGEELAALVDANDEFVFQIAQSSGSRTLSVTAVDEAGNSRTVEIKRFWVTANVLVRFFSNTWFPVATAAGAAVITGEIFLRRKHKIFRNFILK